MIINKGNTVIFCQVAFSKTYGEFSKIVQVHVMPPDGHFKVGHK